MIDKLIDLLTKRDMHRFDPSKDTPVVWKILVLVATCSYFASAIAFWKTGMPITAELAISATAAALTIFVFGVGDTALLNVLCRLVRSQRVKIFSASDLLIAIVHGSFLVVIGSLAFRGADDFIVATLILTLVNECWLFFKLRHFAHRSETVTDQRLRRHLHACESVMLRWLIINAAFGATFLALLQTTLPSSVFWPLICVSLPMVRGLADVMFCRRFYSETISGRFALAR